MRLPVQVVQKEAEPEQVAQGERQLSHTPAAELKYWPEPQDWVEPDTQVLELGSFLVPAGHATTQASAVFRLVGQVS
jgi:hypothetical protein